MALRYLLDTSVLKRLRRPQVRLAVEPLAAAGELARSSVCDLEVGYSARNASEWDELVTALDAVVRVDTTAEYVRRALQVHRQLAERSQPGRKIPDLLIAATSEDLQLAVLHYDSDYDLIATVTGQVCTWVAPAGTVD